MRSAGRALAALLGGLILLALAGRYGATLWSERPVTEIGHAHGLAVDPVHREVLWIGGHTGLVRVTTGRVWRQIGRQGYDMMGFVMSPAGRGTMLTSGHPGPRDRRPEPLGVEVSRDRGRTWRPLALAGQADFHAMAVSTANPQVLYAWNVFGRKGLYRSRDGGRSWTPLGDRGLRQVFALAAHPARPAVVLAGTADGLLISEDAGETWATLAPSLRENVLYLATFNGDLYRSVDGGRSRERWLARGRILYER